MSTDPLSTVSYNIGMNSTGSSSFNRMIIFVLTLASVLILAAVTAGIRTEEDHVTVVYGETQADIPAYKASVLGIDLSDQVTVTDNINYEEPGEYGIQYTCRLFGISMMRKTIPVKVVDIDSPDITLPEGNVVFTRVGQEISLPEYTVTDNHDDPEDIAITFDEHFDTSKEGVYDSSVTACDVSGNCRMKSLRMVVGEIAEEDFTPGRFDLFSYDHTGVIKRRDGTFMSRSDYDKLYFIGDSNYLIMSMNEGGLNPARVIARYALAPGTFEHPAYYNNKEVSRNALELVRDLKPEAVVIHMGLSECGNGDPLLLEEMYAQRIEQLLQIDPDLQIIVSAVTPVVKDAEAAATQEQINRVNYCLLRMCEELDIPMIYSSEVFFDESGYGDPGHFQPDGFHIQGGDFKLYTDYVRETAELRRQK